MSDINDQATALQIAEIDASARYQSALTASANAAQAQVAATQINADAQVEIAAVDSAWHKAVAVTESEWRTSTATIEAAWRNSVAVTDASWRNSVATIDATARNTVATIEAASRTSVADTEAGWRNTVATTEATWRETVARTEATSQTAVASIDASWRTGVATIEAEAQVSAASLSSQATIQAATTSANAQIASETTRATASTGVATIESDGRVTVANVDAGSRITQANIESDSRQAVATTEATASNYRADREYAGVVLTQATAQALLGVKIDFANDKFNAVFPLIASISGGGFREDEPEPSCPGRIGFQAKPGRIGFGGSAPTIVAGNWIGDSDPELMGSYSRTLRMGSGDVKTTGIGYATGTSAPSRSAATSLPFISTSGVLTPGQIQQQVNQAYARSDAKIQSEIRRLVSDMAGRGFSASSPVLAALQVGLVGQGLRASLQTATQVRLDAAKLNADAVYTGQKAVSDQFIAQEQVYLDDAKNSTTRTVGILNAVAQMIGSAL